MIGLRTQESEKFIKYFEIVQTIAQDQGCVFYFDTGDGRDFETDQFEGEDLMGWLIPDEKAKIFELEWNNWNELDDWSDYYCWAIWYNSDNLYVTFER